MRQRRACFIHYYACALMLNAGRQGRLFKGQRFVATEDGETGHIELRQT